MLRPGVGRAGSTLEAKIAEFRGTFDVFGVSDAIDFVHGSSADLLAATNPRHIRLLLLDAGGRIEAGNGGRCCCAHTGHPNKFCALQIYDHFNLSALLSLKSNGRHRAPDHWILPLVSFS
jgi:hypothetical protein